MQAWRGQGGRAFIGKGQDMTTPRNRAIYKAKQDFAIMRTHGRPGGLIRLDTEDGARWSFTDPDSGFVVILKHAADYRELGGAVDAARTKAANAKRGRVAPFESQERRNARAAAAYDAKAKTTALAEEPAPVDPAAGLDMGVELITEARPVRIAGGRDGWNGGRPAHCTGRTGPHGTRGGLGRCGRQGGRAEARPGRRVAQWRGSLGPCGAGGTAGELVGRIGPVSSS